jgi:hypothetical protein
MELPPEDTGRVPVDVVEAEPRLFGMTPPVLTFGLGTAALALGIAFFALGRWVVGVILAVLALALLVLFVDRARRRPTSPFTQASSRLVGGMASRTRFALGSIGAWSQAGREVVRLRREMRALGIERQRTQFTLGDAAYRDDRAQMKALRARLRDIDGQLAAADAAARAAVEGTRRRIGRERDAIRPTERISSEDDVAAGERS